MNISSAEIMNRGMRCLLEKLGVVEAEQFVSTIIRERFDYTTWQREYFDSKTAEEISMEAEKFEKSHPYQGNGIRL